MDLRQDPILRQQTFDQAVSLVQKVFPRLSEFMIPMFAEWDSYRRGIAHVLRLHEVYKACSSEDVPIRERLAFAELLASAGNYLYEVNISGSGLDLLSTSANICKKLRMNLPACQSTGDPAMTSQEAHPSLAHLIQLEATALTISHGIIERTQGLSSADKAMTYISRALDLRQQHAEMDLSGDERFSSLILLSNAFNDMACYLLDVHRYDEAEAYLLKSLSLKDELGQSRPIPEFEYAESKINLACVRLGQGRVEDALQFSKEATELIEKVDGHANDHTRFLFVRGVCYYWAGQLETALEHLKKANEIRVRTFGKSGCNTLHSTFALAMVLYRLKRLDEAG